MLKFIVFEFALGFFIWRIGLRKRLVIYAKRAPHSQDIIRQKRRDEDVLVIFVVAPIGDNNLVCNTAVNTFSSPRCALKQKHQTSGERITPIIPRRSKFSNQLKDSV